MRSEYKIRNSYNGFINDATVSNDGISKCHVLAVNFDITEQ